MFKIYQVSTNLEIASASDLKTANELIDTLGAYYGLLEIR